MYIRVLALSRLLLTTFLVTRSITTLFLPYLLLSLVYPSLRDFVLPLYLRPSPCNAYVLFEYPHINRTTLGESNLNLSAGGPEGLARESERGLPQRR